MPVATHRGTIFADRPSFDCLGLQVPVAWLDQAVVATEELRLAAVAVVWFVAVVAATGSRSYLMINLPRFSQYINTG